MGEGFFRACSPVAVPWLTNLLLADWGFPHLLLANWGFPDPLLADWGFPNLLLADWEFPQSALGRFDELEMDFFPEFQEFEDLMS